MSNNPYYSNKFNPEKINSSESSTSNELIDSMSPFQLRVYDLNNNEHKVSCEGYEHTIGYLQFMLSMERGMNPADIILYLGQTKLNEFKTLRYYGINSDSKLKMFYRMRTGLDRLRYI
ncbi:ubiquitin like domain containing protein [Yasminevirus sp. GU-2018]|uniref:Ubiquitin like domain containing protein n=1 Tax=Yasminevirus sp. GU-2018 TaxID=2420051 RepID=A0A5K0UB20_9VIRU|nr:ubiquitin like domain containing protein [Yasminevirus sp. GU-2018]